MSEENQKRQKEILEGHKKVGKRFIPPMLQLEKLQLISYVHRLLPEILWIGLINHSLGYKEGIDVCLRLSRYAQEVQNTEQSINFALASAYSLLSEEKKKQLIECINDADILEQLQLYLSPLTMLYNGFPMAFIGRPRDSEAKHLLVLRLKTVVEALMNKYNLPGMAAQTAVM